MRMRRNIAVTLVFFVLFANLAWASDLHEAGAAHGSDATVSLDAGFDRPSGDGGTGHDGLKSGQCDHCCHGSAHYVGVPLVVETARWDGACTSPAFSLTGYHSRAQEPLLQPPRV